LGAQEGRDTTKSFRLVNRLQERGGGENGRDYTKRTKLLEPTKRKIGRRGGKLYCMLGDSTYVTPKFRKEKLRRKCGVSSTPFITGVRGYKKNWCRGMFAHGPGMEDTQNSGGEGVVNFFPPGEKKAAPEGE